jgi:hypothetical protein
MSRRRGAMPRARLPGREYYGPAAHVPACGVQPLPGRARAAAGKALGRREAGGRRGKIILWALRPLILLFLIGFAYILHEEFFTGIDMFRVHPSNE